MDLGRVAKKGDKKGEVDSAFDDRMAGRRLRLAFTSPAKNLSGLS